MYFDEVIESLALQAQYFHGLGPIVTALRQGAEDKLARKRLQRFIVISNFERWHCQALGKIKRQILLPDQFALAFPDAAFDDVLQFADVSRPGVPRNKSEDRRFKHIPARQDRSFR